MSDSENSEFKKKPPMPSFQGFFYQQKLLMLYLQRGLKKNLNFKLGTDIKEVHKFDDLVFKHSKVVDGKYKDHFVILQAKHKATANTKITYRDIFNNENVSFGLVKYYSAFKKAKNEKLFEDGVIEHAIIYTNAKFDLFGKIPEKDDNWQKLKNIKNIISEIEADQDDGLSLCKIEGGKFYQFKSDLVLPVLKSMISVYHIIAQKLIEVLTNDKKYLFPDDEILKHYDYLLVTQVIDMKENTLRKEFIDDVGNDTGRRKLRSALDEVAKHENVDLNKIIGNKLKIRENFGKKRAEQNWPEDVVDGDIEEFLKTFVFATGHPNEIDLGKIILSELGDQYPEYDADLIYSYLAIVIENWMTGGNFGYDKTKNPSESRFISFKDAENFIQTTKTELNNFLFRGPTMKYENYAIEFDDTSFTNSIHDFLSSDVRILNIVTEHIIISSIKLFKELSKTYSLKKLIYARLKSLNNNIIDAFKSKSTYQLLVIELDLNKKKYDDWMEQISEIIDAIENGNEKKLIIISNERDILEDILSEYMIFSEIHNDENTLNNLTKDSQSRFLNIKIKFQEFNVKLGDVINSDVLKKSVSGEILMRILNGKTINIGNQIVGLNNVENYYIERQFIRRLKSDKNNLYLLSEINEKDLCSENQNFAVIEKQERLTENESDIFKREVEKNIYMLRKKGHEFMLIKKSNESFDKSDFENVIESSLNFEINLISGIAGMGKSTLFTSLSRKMKKHNPKLWVIKIDLNSASSMLNKMKYQEIQLENVIDFLNIGANHQSVLEKTIFEQHLQMGNVVLYFDAFDEVCPDFKEVIIKIIKVLKDEANIKKIWISSRPYDSILNDLKCSFKDISLNQYDIEPFTEHDRKELLKNFWGQSFEINEEFFVKFADTLFELFNESIHNEAHEFLGIVLHTMIIGVIFKDIFENFHKSDLSKIDELRQELMKMLKLSAIYEKFVEIKFEIYWVEKKKVDSNKLTLENVKKNERAKCLENWKILALDTLFNGNELAIFLSEEDKSKLNEIKYKFKEKGDDVGIMNGIANDIPFFIHRTFAEYFAAVFIFDSFTKDDKKSLEITNYFLDNMINQEHFVTCQFMESMFDDENSKRKDNHTNLIRKLNGEKLYIALKNNWQWIAVWLIENDISLEYESHIKGKLTVQLVTSSFLSWILAILDTRKYESHRKNEYNLLHLVYSQQKDMEKTNHLIKIIIDKLKTENKLMRFLEEKDSHKNTTLDVAVKYGKLNNIKYLLDQFVDLDSVVMNENINGENLLHHAASKYCNDDAFTYLLNLIKNDRIIFEILLMQKNRDGNTPFHVAVINGQSNKIKKFLEESDQLEIKDKIIINVNERGENVLHHAANKYCDNASFVSLLNFIKPDKMESLLLKRNNDGNTPLIVAMNNGQLIKLNTIFEESAKINILDSVIMNEIANGENILHRASSKDCDNYVFAYLLYFIKSNTDKMRELISKKNDNGYTPFDVAIINGQSNKLKSIIEESIKLGILDSLVINENENGSNVLHLAADKYCNDEAFAFLLDSINSDPFKMENMLLKRDNEGETPLDVAVKCRQVTKIKSILEESIALGIYDRIVINENESDQNVLHLAANKYCNDKAFDFLLDSINSDLFKMENILLKRDNEDKLL